MARYAWLGGLVLAIVVVVGVIVVVNSDKTKSLRIFIWEEYIDPEVFRLFEREFGAVDVVLHKDLVLEARP